MIKSKEQKRVSFITNFIMIFLSLAVLLPFVLLIMSSLTENASAIKYGYSFIPKKFSLEAYRYLITEWKTLGKAYFMTIVVTVIGTALCLILTSTMAYALSNKDIPGKKILTFLVVFSMLFNGGLVATYFVYTNLVHIKDTIWALIVPGVLVSGFNIILMKNYFSGNIGDEILDSARIDGAGEIKIFLKIVVPLSVPMYATIGLLSAVSYWNEWKNGMYYLTQQNGSQYYTIQLILNRLNDNISYLAANAASMGIAIDMTELPTTTMRMAIAVVAILPIIIAYPFFQKYFVKGITVGGVKG